MALLTRQEIVNALTRLGQLAMADGYTLRLVLVGGAAMVLGYDAPVVKRRAVPGAGARIESQIRL